MSEKIIVADAEGQSWGPYTQEQIREYLEAGNFTPMHWAMHEGDSDWTQLGELIEPVIEEPKTPPPSQPPTGEPPPAKAEEDTTEEDSSPGLKAPRQIMSGAKTIDMRQHSPQAAAKKSPSVATPAATPKATPSPGGSTPKIAGNVTSTPATWNSPIPKEGITSPGAGPSATPATPATPAGGAARTPSPTPTGSPVKSPAPRELAPAQTTKSGGIKDPLALPILVVGALLAIGGLTLLYMDIDYLWYAAGMTIAAVLASLYGMLRGQLVPGLMLLVVTLVGAGVVGFLSLSAIEQEKIAIDQARIEERQEKEDKRAEEFVSEAKQDAEEAKQTMSSAILTLEKDQSDESWAKAQKAVDKYIQLLQVLGTPQQDKVMQSLSDLQEALTDRDHEAVREAYAELPK